MSDKFYNPYTDRLVSKNGPTYRKICKRLAKEEFESLVASKKSDKPRLVKREPAPTLKPKVVPKATPRAEYKTVKPSQKIAYSSSESSIDEDSSSNDEVEDSDEDLQFIVG